jgi:hypothetical protein
MCIWHIGAVVFRLYGSHSVSFLFRIGHTEQGGREMEGRDEIELPPLRWQRALSLSRSLWLIRNERAIVAVVDEVGRYLRSWTFYLLHEDFWEELIEFGSHGPPVEGIRPYFGSIVEYATARNPSYSCVLVVERDAESIWWLLYYRLRTGVYLLLCAFQSRYSNVEHERMETSSGEDLDETDSSEFVQLVYDF